MLDGLLLLAMPYIAILFCVIGSIYRYKTNQFSYSALSSQFLESRRLLWGSVPWHAGLGILLVIHLGPFLIPGLWASLVASHTRLIIVEAIGMIGGLLALVGLVVLILRRLVNSRIQAVTSPMDLVILTLFLGQIILGLLTASSVRWGAQWATGTTTPYLWSILTLHPDMTYVVQMPVVVRAHIILAWFIIAIIPFSRLVHIFSFPILYLIRPPQRVLWNSPRREHATLTTSKETASRRYFIKGMVGLATGGGLLSIGVLEKTLGFYRGPKLSTDEEAILLERNLKRLESTAEEKSLELERIRNAHILVAHMSELQPKTGKYFIDYEMRPGLAFLNPDNFPLLISAKCTHLGCTVQSDMNAEGQILCPCHRSWFTVQTGVPLAGQPATIPLPIHGWVIMDGAGKVVASKKPGHPPTGTVTPEMIKTCSVYIAKEFAEA